MEKIKSKDFIRHLYKYLVSERDMDYSTNLTVDARNFIENLTLKQKAAFEVASYGEEISSTSVHLGIGLKDLQYLFLKASKLILSDSGPGLYRLRIIRKALRIGQEEIAQALGKTKDAHSKFERAEISFEGKDSEQKIADFIIKRLHASEKFQTVKDNATDIGFWDVVLNQASLHGEDRKNLMSKLLETGNLELKSLLYAVVSDQKYNQIILPKYIRMLFRINNTAVFKGNKSLNLKYIKEMLEGKGHTIGDEEIISNIIRFAKEKGLGLNQEFMNLSDSYIKVSKLTDQYRSTKNYLISMLTENNVKKSSAFNDLLFGLQEVNKDKITVLNKVIDNYFYQIKQ